MMGFKGFLRWFLVVLVLFGAGYFLITQWSWVFSKRVSGQILDVKRVTHPTAILSPRMTEAQLHSYSVLIQGHDGKFYTSSSEDRQWEVAARGFCVEALLYVYPPWDLEKAGTYFNARVKDLHQCPPGTLPPASATLPEEPAAQFKGTEAPTEQPSEEPAEPAR